jgi:thiol-disulfide isomerase/thioredoxin
MRRLLVFLLLLSSALAQTSPGPGLKVLNKGREGQLFNVTEYLSKGKTNLVVFTSPSCGSCHEITPLLVRLAQTDANLAISQLVVDRPDAGPGIDWQSPLCRQYELRSLPAYKMYDASGKLLAEGEAARKRVGQLLVEAKLL